ncbi:serine hydrolase [Candidatus Palauibacter sp.]|uniref:serine hydrolase n=1 Tax=Candidatus Palauibacter sp. TaxID=3101350 RepID=UPI003B51E830
MARNRRFQRLTIFTTLLAFGCGDPGVPESSAPVPLDELTLGAWAPPLMLTNDRFLPSSRAQAPRHVFSGTLALAGAEIRTDPAELDERRVMGRDTKRFPDVSLGFVSDGSDLVPWDRNLIVAGTRTETGSYWDVLVGPGTVWSEPGEDWSRGGFPLQLASSVENETYNGVATFAFNDREVSGVRFQTVTQGRPYFLVQRRLMWGQLAAEYAPDPAPPGVVEEFAAEKARRLPLRPISDLRPLVGDSVFDAMHAGMNPENVVTAAFLVGDTLYAADCPTPFGELPFCREQRFGIWSVTKSTGNTVAALRLAQRYGREILDERVADHLNVTAEHDGWDDVRFRDVLNMATGVGEGSTRTEPNNTGDGYLIGYDDWYTAISRDERIRQVFRASNHPWGPGEVVRYRDQDAFLIGAAMDAYLKHRAGPQADLWRMLEEEVYRPIGVPHAPTNRLIEADGSLSLPQMSQGYYPTVDDLAKIARLLQDGGANEGEQLLHRELTAEVLYRTDARGITFGRPVETGPPSYYLALWHQNYVGEGGCIVDLTRMSGWGGHRVVLFPNGIVGIRISKVTGSEGSPVDGLAAVADRLEPFCP